MKFIHALLAGLIALLVITLIAYFWNPVEYAYGFPHPDHPGMLISKANIDQQTNTRWLGYLFGLGIITVMFSFIFIGSRKKGRPTVLGKYIYLGLAAFLFVFSGMVFSHWKYAANEGGTFFASMPVPTAWMVFGVWFVPIIITIAFVVKFDECVISEEEIKEFEAYLISAERTKEVQ